MLHHFGGDDGANPKAGLTRAGDALYGTTYLGGASNRGAVFRMDLNGAGFTVLKSFGGSDGAKPRGRLEVALDGLTLYGTTEEGGNFGGTVFRIGRDGRDFAVLKAFEFDDGINPSGGVVLVGTSLYGTTGRFGPEPDGKGTVFRINTDGTDFAVLKSFYQFSGDEIGGAPVGELSYFNGQLFGVTTGFAFSGGGGIFRLDANGSNFSVIASRDNLNPSGLVRSGDTLFAMGGGELFQVDVRGSNYLTLAPAFGEGALTLVDSTLYGASTLGGSADHGVIFRAPIRPVLAEGAVIAARLTETDYARENQSYTDRYQLLARGDDYVVLTNMPDAWPFQSSGTFPLLRTADGLLGTMTYGAAGGNGGVFRIDLSGSNLTLLHSFGRTDGANPVAAVIESGGFLYGTTYLGGAANRGTVFRMARDGGGLTAIKHFAGQDGANPFAELVADGDTLYGTTYTGGTSNLGTVFRMDVTGSNYVILQNFRGGNGANPVGLMLSGNALFGTTHGGGVSNLGTVFRLDLANSNLTVLKSFLGRDGAEPFEPLVLQGARLYGTTRAGGFNGAGTVFKLDATGSNYVVLHSFAGGDGAEPAGGLTIAEATLYGVTRRGGLSGGGTIFRISLDGRDHRILKNFSSGFVSDDGREPLSRLIVDGKTLYGATTGGGANARGTLFKLVLRAGEWATYARAASGELVPELRLLDAAAGTVLTTSNWLSSDVEALQLFRPDDGVRYEVQIGSRQPGGTGDYELALYPVLRPRQTIDGTLSDADAPLEPGPGGGHPSRSYVLWDLAPFQSVRLRLETAGFDGRLEVARLDQPSSRQAEAVAGLGDPSAVRLDFTHRAENDLIRVSSVSPQAAGSYRLTIEPLLWEGQRSPGRLAPDDPVAANGGHVDAYVLGDSDLPSGHERAVYARAAADSSFTPALRVLDGTAGTILADSGGPSGPGETTVIWSSSARDGQRVELTSSESGSTGDYEIGLYPVIRPGSLVHGSLTSLDPWVTNRTAAVGGGRWTYDDYLLPQVRGHDRLAVRVEPAAFAPFIEVRLLVDETPQRYVDGRALEFGGGDSGPARNFLIRVTSSASGSLGPYTLRVETAATVPAVWGFSPTAGPPGTWVTVRGTNFLDGLNPAVTGVRFGAVPAASTEPADRGMWQEFDAQVPDGAVTGPIVVETDTGSAESTNAFVVLAPIGGIRREGIGVAFAVSNVVAGAVHVVESASDLNLPIVWRPVATNVALGAGVWRFTNDNSGQSVQEFYRVRRQ